MNKINYLNMRVKMFISSYFPLYIILLVLNIENYNSFSKLIKIFKFENIKISLFVFILIILLLISLESIYDLKNTKASESHTFSSISNSDDAIINYMMTYIIPLLSTDFLSTKTLIMNVILFFIIGFMYVRLNLVYLNPLWLIWGYSMYKADNSMIIITNISYSNIKSLENESLKASLLCDRVYLIQKCQNKI
ncbi:hypothetical protein [Clostridium tyrobutyricum]|uniref:hypothetical protein n=1 Tax=Clostridium tyrobutyricum TaxID=1519 RepID=UPI002B2039DF|nr:hypothetical protein [Clostridium tyrobutyricum]MEA5008245.1 hypothetical protein [Clostridium tyrobutyricum]